MDQNGNVGCVSDGGWGASDDWASDKGTTSLSETIPEPRSLEEAMGMVVTNDSQTEP